jgi:hypothetical protein
MGFECVDCARWISGICRDCEAASAARASWRLSLRLALERHWGHTGLDDEEAARRAFGPSEAQLAAEVEAGPALAVIAAELVG